MKQGNKTVEDEINNGSKLVGNDEKNDLELQSYSNGNQVREEKQSQFL